MINKRFLNFKTYNGFLAKKKEIPQDSIVFIQDKPCIWARGKEYVCDGPYDSKIEDNTLEFKNVNDDIVFTISLDGDVLTLKDSNGNTLSAEYVSKSQFNNLLRNIDAEISNLSSTKADKIDITGFATLNDVVDLLSDYQHKLIAKSGIKINAENEISCDIDTSVYEIVDELPDENNVNPNKFYIRREEVDGETVFVQYKWDENANDFISFGRTQPTISLSEYVTRDEASLSFAPKGSYVTSNEFERTVNTLSQMFTNVEYAGLSDIDDIYLLMANYLTASDLSDYVKMSDLLDLRKFVVDNYVHNSRIYTINENGEQEIIDDNSSEQLSNTGNGVAVGNIVVDDKLSMSSSNPVQNHVIYAALRGKLDTSVLSTLARKDELSTKADTALLSNYATKDYLNNSIANKLNTLVAGSGISIDNNKISVTLDTKLFVIVEELPETNIDKNKIYILREIIDGLVAYTEYRRTNGTWQKLGAKLLEMALDGYYTKSQSDERYLIAEGTYVTTTEAQLTYQPKRDDYVVSEDISELLADINNTYQLKGDFALRQEVENALIRLQQVIDEKYVLKADVYTPNNAGFSSSTPVTIPINNSGSSSGGSSSGGGSSKMVTLTASEYAQLVEDNLVQQDVYYFTYEGEAPSTYWHFGDTFPIILTENWAFGGTFPITLM